MFKKKKQSPDELNPYANAKKKNAFVAWYTEHKKATAPATILLLFAIGYAVFFFAFLNTPEPKPEPRKQEDKEEVVEEPTKYYSPLTGVEVASEADTKKPINAVILENTPAARPQSGLQEAEVVYEGATEGGITRFLAIYQQNQPELIGPVRSLRPFFVDAVAPYDAGVLHVGGSKEALDEIRNGNYRDLDQFFNGGTYWRSTDRYAPHNVYTNSQNITALNQAKGYETSNPKPMPRAEADPIVSVAPTPTPQFNVHVSGPMYDSTWIFDAASGVYHRHQGGGPHTDREKGQITAEVVVTLNQSFSAVGGGRYNYQTTGTGTGTVHYKGNAYPVNWHKADRQSQYSFTSAHDNQEFLLPKGVTWFTAVPQ